MDDVLIEIQDITIDLQDIDFYVDGTGGVWNETGYYYLVLHYEYQKIYPPNESSVLVILPSQRATKYDTSKHLFLACLEVKAPGGTYQVDEVFNYDPDEEAVRRITVGGGGAGTSVNYSEMDTNTDGLHYYATSDDDTIAVNTGGGICAVHLPPVSSTDHQIRVVKMSSDANAVIVVADGTDHIEENVQISLYNQFDSVNLAPYPTDSVWIEV
jgi:hypothetical protein